MGGVDVTSVMTPGRRVDVARLLLTVLAAVLYAAGWVAGVAVCVAAAAVAAGVWVWSALVVGWRDGRGAGGG